MNSKSEEAKANFLKGYNCCQSVVLAFADELNLDKNTALMLSSSFGGGMGRLREVCGAVSGMFIIAGLKFGYSSPDDKEAKTAHYKRIQELAEKFREKNKYIVCRELLGLTSKTESYIPEDRTNEYYKKRPCANLVGDAALIIDEYIKGEMKL